MIGWELYYFSQFEFKITACSHFAWRGQIHYMAKNMDTLMFLSKLLPQSWKHTVIKDACCSIKVSLWCDRGLNLFHHSTPPWFGSLNLKNSSLRKALTQGSRLTLLSWKSLEQCKINLEMMSGPNGVWLTSVMFIKWQMDNCSYDYSQIHFSALCSQCQSPLEIKISCSPDNCKLREKTGATVKKHSNFEPLQHISFLPPAL